MLGHSALGETALGDFGGSSNLTAGVGAFVISGQDVGLYSQSHIDIGTGQFTLTFNPVQFGQTRVGLSVISGGGVRGLRASSGGGGKG